jgi:hypothetical protein
MADTTDKPKGNNEAEPSAQVTVDATPPAIIAPVMMTDAYVEIGGADLSCLGLEVSIEPELKPIEQITFCGVRDYPGPSKWHFKAKLAQDFSTGSTDATLQSALSAYKTAQTPCAFKVRPHKSSPPSPTNPSIEGSAVPQDYTVFGGAAGAASEVDVDWIMTAPPTRVTA